MIDMMLDALEEESKNQLDDISIIATALIFLIAGYDTTSVALGFATYELAKNPDVQKKLRVN